jgi:hypothetical protein
MTAILLHHDTQAGRVRVWSDDEYFDESGGRYPVGDVPKVTKHTIKAKSGAKCGEMLVGHAGSSAVGQYLRGIPLPRVASKDRPWKLTDAFWWQLTQHWYTKLYERGLWNNEEPCTADGSDELLVAIRDDKGTIEVRHFDGSLSYAAVHEPWAAAGLGAATLLGAVEALDANTDLTVAEKVDAAFSVARRHYAFVGDGMHVTDLEV